MLIPLPTGHVIISWEMLSVSVIIYKSQNCILYIIIYIYMYEFIYANIYVNAHICIYLLNIYVCVSCMLVKAISLSSSFLLK